MTDQIEATGKWSEPTESYTPFAVGAGGGSIAISPTELAYLRACEEEVGKWSNNQGVTAKGPIWAVSFLRFQMDELYAAAEKTRATRAAWGAERGSNAR